MVLDQIHAFSDSSNKANTLQISIMRKENLFIQTNSLETRDALIKEFKECVEFAGSGTYSPQ